MLERVARARGGQHVRLEESHAAPEPDQGAAPAQELVGRALDRGQRLLREAVVLADDASVDDAEAVEEAVQVVQDEAQADDVRLERQSVALQPGELLMGGVAAHARVHGLEVRMLLEQEPLEPTHVGVLWPVSVVRDRVPEHHEAGPRLRSDLSVAETELVVLRQRRVVPVARTGSCTAQISPDGLLSQLAEAKSELEQREGDRGSHQEREHYADAAPTPP